MHQGEAAQLQAFVLAERLRDAGLDVMLHCATANGIGNFKSQMKRADASGAAVSAVILGEGMRVAKGEAAVKALRGDAEERDGQASRKASRLITWLTTWLIRSLAQTSMIIPNTFIIIINHYNTSWHTISKNKSR